MLSTCLESQKGSMNSLDDRLALVLANGLSKVRTSSALSQVALDPVEVLDLAQDPAGASGVVSTLESVMKFTSDVGPTGGAFERNRMLF